MLLDICFIANEKGRNLREWLAALLGADRRQFWIGEADRLATMAEKMGLEHALLPFGHPKKQVKT